MAEESESKSWFELKPIQFNGRVWAIYEWVTILFFLGLIPGFFISLYWGLFEFIIALALIGYFQARSDDEIFKLNSTEPSEGASESKLPSKEEAAEWAKKNSESEIFIISPYTLSPKEKTVKIINITPPYEHIAQIFFLELILAR